jgi:hypothetical protein
MIVYVDKEQLLGANFFLQIQHRIFDEKIPTPLYLPSDPFHLKISACTKSNVSGGILPDLGVFPKIGTGFYMEIAERLC